MLFIIGALFLAMKALMLAESRFQGLRQGLLISRVAGRPRVIGWLLIPLPPLFHGPFIREVLLPITGF